MKTKSKISVYILCSGAAVLLLSCVIVVFSSAITPTATGEPTPNPPCTPDAWQLVENMPVDLYGAAGASDGTYFYAAGGYSFSQSNTLAVVNRYDPATNTWTSLADMPQAAVMATAVYYPPNNKIYVFGGEDGVSGTNYNITRIYDIATNTWTTGPNMPDVRSFAAGGFIPATGKMYIISGYNTGQVTSAQPNTYAYDPVADTWQDLTGTLPFPHPAGGFAFGVINNKLYIAGGRDAANTIINLTWEFDPVAGTYTAKTDEPSSFQNDAPGSAAAQGLLWVFGGGNPFVESATATATQSRSLEPKAKLDKAAFPLARIGVKPPSLPSTSNGGRSFNPATDSWNNSANMNVVRSFPAGGAIGNNLIIAAGGYNGSTTVASAETAGVPGGTPGPWSTASPYPISVVRYGFAQTATHFYVFGGVSNGGSVNNVNRLDLATGMWEARAPMPFASEGPTCALLPDTVSVFCAAGGTGSGFAVYDITTDSWTPLASIPGGDHYGSASGAFNGKVFVAGGTIAFTNAVQVYDVASNTWSAGTAAPNDFEFAGYQQVGQYLYVVGGFESSGPDKVAGDLSSVLNRGQQPKEPKVPMANNMTTWRLDMSSAPGVWSVGPAFTQGRADFGLAYDAGTNKLYALGGDTTGGGFFDSTNEVDELSLGSWPAGSWVASPPNLILPNRQANQAGFYAAGQIWTVGGVVGQTMQLLAEVQRRCNTGPCGTPTATPTIPPPSVTTNAATNVTSSAATLNGSVNPNGQTTSVHFEYGTTTSYGFMTPGQSYTGNTMQPVSANISGLSPNTTYHFRLVGTNSGGTSFGSDMTFTTHGPPMVTTGAATNVTSSSATLHGMVNPNGLSTNVHFEYGTTTSYGSNTAVQSFSGNTTQPVSANIPGLSPNTTYHFRLVGTNSGGTSFGYDVTFRFDTNTTGPVIITNPATSVMSSSATLNGTVNPRGLTTSIYFQYGASASYGLTTAAQSYNGSTTQPVTENIPGLGPSTTYHFRLVGMNSGGTSFGNDRTFTTAAAAVPPVIISPTTATATVGQLFVYQITATNGPTSYTAAPLPQGMTFDGASGMLGGTPISPGTTQIHLTASNSVGTSPPRTLTLTVQSVSNPGLTIVSGTTITARKGQFFSFEVFTAGGSANARLTATHLPPGLSADPLTGLISGTPTRDGSFGVILTVTDGSATKTSTLQLVFTSDPAVPVITSPREVTLVPGQFFSYRIVDSSQQSGTTFTLTGQLPPGLRFNPVTGVISGVYNPHADNPLQNGGSLLGNIQTNTHHGSKNASNPLAIFQQRPCTLLKVATRGVVQSGNNQLVGKVNIAGNVSEKVMVRATGPSLRVNGVPLTGRLQNPTLELDHPYSIGQNDNWRTTVIGGIITSNQVAAIQRCHLLNGRSNLPLVPTNPLESAIIANALAPGNYSAIVRPKSGTTGTVGSVEFYDLGPATLNPRLAAQLANFSTRSLVQTGNNVMRTDFTLGSRAGTGSPVRVLLRALGPSLSVQGRLQNPTLRLYNGTGVSIAYNDNWMSANNKQQIINSGYAPTNNLESAILMTLSAGNYTAVVTGQNNTTGIARLEGYVLPP